MKTNRPTEKRNRERKRERKRRSVQTYPNRDKFVEMCTGLLSFQFHRIFRDNPSVCLLELTIPPTKKPTIQPQRFNELSHCRCLGFFHSLSLPSPLGSLLRSIVHIMKSPLLGVCPDSKIIVHKIMYNNL